MVSSKAGFWGLWVAGAFVDVIELLRQGFELGFKFFNALTGSLQNCRLCVEFRARHHIELRQRRLCQQTRIFIELFNDGVVAA